MTTPASIPKGTQDYNSSMPLQAEQALNPVASQAPPCDTTARKPGLSFIPLLLILAACVAFRWPLATGPAPLAFPLHPELLAQPWKLLLPFDFGGERYRWTPTGYALIGLLNLAIPAPILLILFIGLVVVVAYVGSWMTFRSRILSCTLALGMGFGTQFNYAYIHNGGIIWMLFCAYLLLNMFSLHALAVRPPEYRWPKVSFLVSLVLFALCWEQWLDYLVFLLFGCGFMYLLCRRDPKLLAAYGGRIRFVALTTILVAVLYFAVKLPYSGEHFTPGHESDTIFTYSHAMMGVEDFISNLFTYPYIALTNFFPSWFNTSNSLYYYGTEGVLAEQHGYHPERTHLVAMHHLFLWHFYAGAFFLAFAWATWRWLRSAWTSPDQHVLLVVALLGLIWTGFATHTIFKFRPYMSVPLLAYKCMISVIGVSLLLSYGLARFSDSWTGRWKAGLVIGGVWAIVLFAGVERFRYQTHLSAQAGLGAFPDPVREVKRLVAKKHKPHHHEVSSRSAP